MKRKFFFEQVSFIREIGANYILNSNPPLNKGERNIEKSPKCNEPEYSTNISGR